MNQDSKNIYAVTLVIVAMMAPWCIDISVSAMNMGGILTNGFHEVQPVVGYHLALYILILSLLLFAFLAMKSPQEKAH